MGHAKGSCKDERWMDVAHNQNQQWAFVLEVLNIRVRYISPNMKNTKGHNIQANTEWKRKKQGRKSIHC